MTDFQIKSSLEDLDIDGMLRKKDDEFTRLLEESAAEKTAKIAELTSKVESLEEELKNQDDAGLIQRELSECKKELEKQRRKHKSEVNKLQNTLDLQKSKEARLQSHIKSMESQITGMVSDYESRLEEAYYATCAVKGALK
jgi:type I site-specific restriction endonuclease